MHRKVICVLYVLVAVLALLFVYVPRQLDLPTILTHESQYFVGDGVSAWCSPMDLSFPLPGVPNTLCENEIRSWGGLPRLHFKSQNCVTLPSWADTVQLSHYGHAAHSCAI
jgi:hypothetical protein